MARTATVQIKQIAERVGLSPSTVSIVLNGRGDEMRISKESQRRVLEAAKEMSYRPSGNARIRFGYIWRGPGIRFWEIRSMEMGYREGQGQI